LFSAVCELVFFCLFALFLFPTINDVFGLFVGD
jgi:hypothetical protein